MNLKYATIWYILLNDLISLNDRRAAEVKRKITQNE